MYPGFLQTCKHPVAMSTPASSFRKFIRYNTQDETKSSISALRLTAAFRCIGFGIWLGRWSGYGIWWEYYVGTKSYRCKSVRRSSTWWWRYELEMILASSSCTIWQNHQFCVNVASRCCQMLRTPVVPAGLPLNRKLETPKPPIS